MLNDNLTLNDINRGLIIEQVNEHLSEIIQDIVNPNKIATKKRSLILQIDFAPSKSRRDAQVTYQVTVKPSGHIIRESQTIYIGKDEHGNPIAKPWVPNQQELPGTEDAYETAAGSN